MAADVFLFSNVWTLLLPAEPVVVDELVLPAGVDFDSLIVSVDSLQGFFATQQAKRKEPVGMRYKHYLSREQLHEELRKQKEVVK